MGTALHDVNIKLSGKYYLKSVYLIMLYRIYCRLQDVVCFYIFPF